MFLGGLMYGDPSHLRAMAAALEDEGERVRRSAARLQGHARDVRWQSLAADAMRRRVLEQVRAVHTVARQYHQAGAALRAHADAVEQSLDRIRLIEAAARELLVQLASDAGPGVVAAPNGRRVALASATEGFAVPSPGHRDWLEVPARLARLGVRL